MKISLRSTFVAIFLLVTPLITYADISSLVWGGQGSGVSQVTMTDGGTYTVLLNMPAPAYVTGPDRTPDGGFVFELFGSLYKINGSEREYIVTLNQHVFFDDPDDPFDEDVQFAWPSAGTYELDLLSFPPPVPFFIDAAQQWFASLPFANVAYAQFGDLILLDTIQFTIEEVQTEPDPVIIIPGILGSEQHNGEWVIDPILHTYDDLIATLDANGYTPDFDLFTLPYDWRKSNVETAVLLKEKIDEVKGACDCDKVDLVAHSMGGLVARQYIQSDDYENNVDQLIFLGTPHLGAPSAYLMWEGGEVGPFGFRADYLVSFLMETVLSLEAHENGYGDLFSYVRGAPISSVQQLLPTYSYISDSGVLRTYPNNYPVNEFLDELNEGSVEFLTSGIKIFNFIGDTGSDTMSGIDSVDLPSAFPKWEHGYPRLFDAPLGTHGLILGIGDGTVPKVSASYIDSNPEVFSLEHRDLVTGSEARVFNILTGKEAPVLVTDKQGLFKSLLQFQMQSPADLLIVAPDGKKIGKDFNGQEINEIPNAFYTGFNTDTEFITILNPLDGEYKIYSQGTGSGSYTVETNFISEATTTETSFTGNTAPGITSELNVEVEDGAVVPDSLEVVVTYESTLADLERIYKLKWINVGIYKSLKIQLQIAKKSHPLVAKPLLQAMLSQLNQYRGTLLKEQGYQILKADIEQLINQ